jgi:hypothetical protein
MRYECAKWATWQVAGQRVLKYTSIRYLLYTKQLAKKDQITINVLVVYIARGVMILMRPRFIARAIERGEPEMARSKARAIWAQKSRDIQALINLNHECTRHDADSGWISLAIFRPWECDHQKYLMVNIPRYKIDGRKRHNGIDFSTLVDTWSGQYTLKFKPLKNICNVKGPGVLVKNLEY